MKKNSEPYVCENAATSSTPMFRFASMSHLFTATTTGISTRNGEDDPDEIRQVGEALAPRGVAHRENPNGPSRERPTAARQRTGRDGLQNQIEDRSVSQADREQNFPSSTPSLRRSPGIGRHTDRTRSYAPEFAFRRRLRQSRRPLPWPSGPPQAPASQVLGQSGGLSFSQLIFYPAFGDLKEP